MQITSKFSKKRIAGLYWPLQATKWIKKQLPALCMATKNQIPFLLLSPLSQALMDFLMEFRLSKSLSVCVGRILPMSLWCSKEWAFPGCYDGLEVSEQLRANPRASSRGKDQETFRLLITSLGLCTFWCQELQLWVRSLANVSHGGALQPGAVELCWGTCQSLAWWLPLGLLVILQALCKYF